MGPSVDERHIAVLLLQVDVELGRDLRRPDLGGYGYRGDALERVHARFVTSVAKSIVLSRLPQRTESHVIGNDDDRTRRKGVGAEVILTRVQNVVSALLHYDGDDEVVSVIPCVVFVEPKDLTAIWARRAIRVAVRIGPGEGWAANDHSTSRDLRTIRAIRVHVGEAGPFVIAAPIDWRQGAETRGQLEQFVILG